MSGPQAPGVGLLAFTSRSLRDSEGSRNTMLRDYFETEASIRESGVPAMIFRNALRWSLETVGAERLMYASDYPFNNRERDRSVPRFLDTAPGSASCGACSAYPPPGKTITCVSATAFLPRYF